MNVLFFTHAINGLLMIAVPILLGIMLARCWRLGWRLWWIGAATFVLSQIGHIPFNLWVSQLIKDSTLYWPLAQQQMFIAVFLGLSAGLFEEGARYLVLKFWQKDARSWKMGVVFGAGHGGAEAIFLGAIVLLNYIILATIRSVDISTLVPDLQLNQTEQQIAIYWSLPWYDSLLGALERIFTLPIQISLAVMVMRSVMHKSAVWFLIAIGYHAMVDGVVILLLPLLGLYWIQLVIFSFSLVSLFIIFRLRELQPIDPFNQETMGNKELIM